jgi:hypothetical protein
VALIHLLRIITISFNLEEEELEFILLGISIHIHPHHHLTPPPIHLLRHLQTPKPVYHHLPCTILLLSFLNSITLLLYNHLLHHLLLLHQLLLFLHRHHHLRLHLLLLVTTKMLDRLLTLRRPMLPAGAIRLILNSINHLFFQGNLIYHLEELKRRRREGCGRKEKPRNKDKRRNIGCN